MEKFIGNLIVAVLVWLLVAAIYVHWLRNIKIVQTTVGL
jgi:hypothetical protein